MILNKTELRILEEFLKDYGTRLTGSQIARKKELNQKTVSNKLKNWEKQGYLKSKTQGRNKLYYLNLEDKEKLKHFLTMIEHQRTMEFYNKNPMVKEIVSQIQGDIVVIFGSYAKGKQTKESDLDMFIVGEYNKKRIRELSERMQTEINVKQYTRKKFEEMDYLLEEIMKSHIIVSGTELFVERRLG